MDSKEIMFDEFDEAEYYIKEDDDPEGVSLADSDDSDLCEEDCNVCADEDEPTWV